MTPASTVRQFPENATLETVMERAIAVGVAVLVTVGFVTSYDTLRLLALTDGGFPAWLAPAVPLSFDLGIVVLSLKIVTAARQGHRAITLRLLVVALSVVSVAVNGTAATGAAGCLLHAIPPAMFVICFESIIATARRRALATSRNQRPRLAVWLLAPRASWRAWRASVLSSLSTSTPPPTERQVRQRQRSRLREVEGGHHPQARAAGMTPPAAVRPASRLQLARAALEAMPLMTAPQLTDHLRHHGHKVSVRTAQRVKAEALAARAC